MQQKVYTGQLPEVGLNQQDDGNLDSESVHIYAGQKDGTSSHRTTQRAEVRFQMHLTLS